MQRLGGSTQAKINTNAFSCVQRLGGTNQTKHFGQKQRQSEKAISMAGKEPVLPKLAEIVKVKAIRTNQN